MGRPRDAVAQRNPCHALAPAHFRGACACAGESDGVGSSLGVGDACGPAHLTGVSRV